MSNIGRIIASCGHELTDEDGDNGLGLDVITLHTNHDSDGLYRYALHSSVCRKCYDEMATKNMISTSDEAEQWIKEGTLPKRMREE